MCGFGTCKPDMNKVELLLANKADANIKNLDKCTAFTVCCRNNQYESLKLLLKHRDESVDGAGIDINATSNKTKCSSLMLACQYSNEDPFGGRIYANEIIDLLISLNVDMRYCCQDGNIISTAFSISVAVGNCYIVEKILNDSESSLQPYIDINELIEHEDGLLTPLILACEDSNKDLVDLLLSHKADPRIKLPKEMKDDFGRTAIITCCKRNPRRYRILYLLLEKYKDNYPELNIDDTDDDGITGLMWMCLNIQDNDEYDNDIVNQDEFIEDTLEYIKLLLDANASPYASDINGRTALSISSDYENVYDMLTTQGQISYLLK
jgi:ankyrin repeat protein